MVEKKGKKAEALLFLLQGTGFHSGTVVLYNFIIII